MSTKPIEIILPRVIESREYQDLINLVSSTLEEIVNYGTQVVHWAAYNPKFKKSDVDVPLLLLSRNIVELADSITILIMHSSIDPCKILLRSALETMLYIKFITVEKSENRAAAYLISYIRNKKNEYLKYKIGSKIHDEFKKKIENDKFIKGGLNPFTEELNKLVEGKIKNLDNWLSNPVFSDVIAEYQRVKENDRLKKRKIKHPWYYYYGGAENIEKLSRLLGYQYVYEVAYRRWSDSIHISDVITGRITLGEDDKPSFYLIRMGADIIEVAKFTIDILLSSYRELIEFIVPEMVPNYNLWYIKEIKKPFLKIRTTKIK